jgi:uncharacterized linocin/CFP29 family protein
MAHDSPVPWTEEQWARIEQTIHQEANAARVAAKFLPLYGPLPKDTDFVRTEKLLDPAATGLSYNTVEDKTTVQLATLQVKVWLRGAQMADPELSSALQLFRRAANVLARLEDEVVFKGLDASTAAAAAQPTGGSALQGWEITSDTASKGLWSATSTSPKQTITTPGATPPTVGDLLVTAVSASILDLEKAGHFGPFAVVLGHTLFNEAENPSPSLVLPQDRIIPFLGGGSLLRSSALDPKNGVVVALGGAPVDLVVATDMSLSFLQVTTDPMYVFRVFEKIVLRIKQSKAISKLELK